MEAATSKEIVGKHYGAFIQDLPPIRVCELTERGWRGLTDDGEVLVVSSNDGLPARPDESIAITKDGEIIGFRAVPPPTPEGLIEDYLFHFYAAVNLLRDNKPGAALREIDLTIRRVPTIRAKFNRAFILLSMGRWPEGFDAYRECEAEPPFTRPYSQRAIEAGIKPWRGQDIAGKRLLLIHDHGFGDSIMMFRFVPMLKAMGADVIMDMPKELRSLASQCGTVMDDMCDADYFCPILHVLGALRIKPQDIPLAPYLTVNDKLIDKWNKRLDGSTRKMIGVAWSVGVPNVFDYPRQIPLSMLVEYFGRGVELISVQKQKAEEASDCGVKVYEFEDFEDCAALMLLLDQIVSVDTAAIHLAGAVGHPNIVGLLSHWHSWRWLSPLYKNITLYRQTRHDDWGSAIAQIG